MNAPALCRFCNQYEAWLDGWCVNCVYFGPGDPHGKRYYAELRTKEKANTNQRKLEPRKAKASPVEEIRRNIERVVGP